MMGIVNPLFWVVLGATVLSGFFALTGYSLRFWRRGQIEEAIGGELKGEALDRQLSALRLMTSFGRSVANLVLVVAMIYWLSPDFHATWRVLVGTLAAAGIVAIFGVGIPNAWAYYSGDRIVARTWKLLLAWRYLLYPVVAVMMALDVPVRRLAGASEDRDENGQSVREEILQAATEGQAEGAVEPEAVEMIESVMDFGQTQAGEIMTPRTDIFALSVETAWARAAEAIVEGGHSRVPVYQGDIDNIIGILYAKDLLRYADQEHPTALRTVMRKPFFVPETKPLNDLLKEFKARKVHIAVVLDEYGGTAGLITIEDLLEEIVGEISDEYDLPEPALMKRLGSDEAEVDGRMYIDDLNDALGLAIPDEDRDYDTVAGLVFSELGYIPTVNETLEAHGARFTVLAADERRITRLHVKKLPRPADEPHP